MNRPPTTDGAPSDDADQPTIDRTHAPEMTVDEATEVYANQWIFMEVTEQDEVHGPQRGFILDHHPRRGEIQPTIMALIASVKAAGQAPEHARGYYVFYGIRRFRTGAEWQEYRREIESSEGERGRGRQ